MLIKLVVKEARIAWSPTLFTIIMPRKKITAKEFVEQATGVRLSAHEKLCAERMKTLNDSINELKREVKSLRQDVSKGKGAVAVLVFIGTLVASIVGFLNFK